MEGREGEREGGKGNIICEWLWTHKQTCMVIRRANTKFKMCIILQNTLVSHTYAHVRGGYRGGSLGAEEPPPLLGYHLLQKSLCLHYHQPLSSLYMLDSVCQTPL